MTWPWPKLVSTFRGAGWPQMDRLRERLREEKNCEGHRGIKLARRKATIGGYGHCKETIHDILVFFKGNFLCRLEAVPEREARGPLAPVEAISGFVE